MSACPYCAAADGLPHAVDCPAAALAAMGVVDAGPSPFSVYKVRRPLAVNPGFRCATCGAGFDCGDGCRCPDD